LNHISFDILALIFVLDKLYFKFQRIFFVGIMGIFSRSIIFLKNKNFKEED